MVAQVIPNFSMSVFLLPLDLCKDIEKMLNSFWWGMKKDDSKGMNWTKWSRMCQRKEVGGIGFREKHDFNIALLGKQLWCLATNKDSLCAKVFKARYFIHTTPLEAALGHNPSFVWPSEWAAQSTIKSEVCWQIGTGEEVYVWTDPWLLIDPDHMVSTLMYEGLKELKVSQLIDRVHHKWDEELIRAMFNSDDQQAIIEIPIVRHGGMDELIWTHEKKGHFSVCSAYHALHEVGQDEVPVGECFFWMNFLKQKVPAKVLEFCWKACNGSIPIMGRLRS